MKSKIFIVCAIFFLIIIAGCGNNNADKNIGENFCTVTDDSGREINFAKKPERIAVVSSSFLEPLHEVGGEIVGRPSSKIKSPDFAKNAAEIGAVYQIDTEKLLACNPDLVIINKGMNERLADILNDNKISYVVADMKT